MALMDIERPFGFPQPALVDGETITLLIERESSGLGNKKLLETAVVPGGATVQEVKMKISALKGWFKSNDCLILGGRELLEQETIGQLAKETASSGFLHVFVRLADVANLSVTSKSGGTFSYNPSQQRSPGRDRAAITSSPQRSALTASLASPDTKQRTSKSLVVRGQVLEENAPLGTVLSKDNGAVVHLVIRRAKVDWQSSKESFELTISTSEDAESVKHKVEAQHGLPANSHALVYNGLPLSSSKSLASYGITKGSVLELVPVALQEPGVQLPSSSPLLSSPEHELYEGFLRAKKGLAKGHAPKLAAAGTGGSYFISGENGEQVAVFKPQDEEPLAVNNPKGNSGPSQEGFRRGVRPGEGATREVAAYLLDHEHFSGVPPTAMVGFRADMEAKIGSLQAFVEAEGDCEERGTGAFDVEEVHKVAILDMRLANTDRNGGNILVRRKPGENGSQYELVPIDHGYCLPSSFQDISFEWIYWPQANKPFSEKSKAYVRRLCVDKDEQTLEANGLTLRPECNRVRKVCTLLLKKAVEANLTPSAIASIMCRETLSMSPLEKLHLHVMSLARREMYGGHAATRNGALDRHDVDDAVYMRHMEAALDEFLEEHLLEGLP